ncbi:MAG: glycosyltransferase [Gammaproteobacteria bacterium]|nr:glycosyltransferase [Gammaproteobacteria bacterium]MCP4476319.1 glycosyltransferase [Gammaproteobacteria bacterium]
MATKISIVIPAHNEEEVLEILYSRLMPVMDGLKKAYEIILINDGSTDRTAEILNRFQQQRPEIFRIIHLRGNFGQHMAIMAGFENVRGEIVITLDADLQNPPEEIPKLVAAMENGHDVVNTYRMDRRDRIWRKFMSKIHNLLRQYIFTPGIKMRDEGSMLRAYHRDLVDIMVSTGESDTFIPVLALTYAVNPTEVGIAHEKRAAGTTSYNFFKLMRYNFDLITGFSMIPLQIFTAIGLLVSTLSLLFVIYLFIRRLLIGPEVQGVFTLFAIAFFIMGIILMGLGIVGEYVGRMFREVRKRPRFVIREIVQRPDHETHHDN